MPPSIRDIIFKVVRPVCYDNSPSEWAYSTGGSCVVVSHNHRYYAVTAQHVPKAYEPHQVLVPYEVGSDAFLPIREVFTVTTAELDDTDHKDIVLFEIWREEVDPSRWRPEACFNLDWNQSCVPSEDCQYLVCGHPDSLNAVNYDTSVLSHQALAVSARLVQRSRFLMIDELEIDVQTGLASMSGYSGGGVFAVIPTGPGKADLRFEGMILRASAESGRVFFLQSKAIQLYIERQQKG